MPIIMITIIIDIEYIHKIYFKQKTNNFFLKIKITYKIIDLKTKTIVMNAEIKAKKKHVERLKERKII